ncbi:MAG TPA: glycosyltransferase family 2 protein [Gemmatimonadaceae bacterium]
MSLGNSRGGIERVLAREMELSQLESADALSRRTLGARFNQASLAIVVTSSCEATVLRPYLASLASECAAIGAKLLVVHAGKPPDFTTLVGAERMSLTLVTAPAGANEGDLRRIGALHAERNVVVFARDTDRERILWAQHLCRGWRTWTETAGRIPVPSKPGATQPGSPRFRPHLSIVVPVHEASDVLERALEAITQSDLQRELWELIVVDDGSSYDAALLAPRYADKLVRLPDGPHGPGYARNRGFEMSLGRNVAFINADVMVRPSTLRRFDELLTLEPRIGAVFGSYDTRPDASNFVSQYRNLTQHYHHQRNAGESSTFWSACGAVRGDAFEQADGFDEWHFRRRQLEDLELGRRIRSSGYRVQLRPEIQVTNLKRWTLGGIIATEIFDRGVPWMRLVNRTVEPTRTSLRNLLTTKKVNIALTGLAALFAILGLRPTAHALLAGAVACVAIIGINDAPRFAFFLRERGATFAAKAVVLDLLYYFVSGVAMLFGWIAQHTVGEPRPTPVMEAFAELEVKTWPPVPSKRAPSNPRGIPVIREARSAAARLKRPGSQLDLPQNLTDVPPVIDVPPNAPLQ